ncbi:MAG: septum formation initiator family protein [Clostridia bacterium]|nr:septum formation initiator family protein [Clostridia bacterium]
MRPRIKLIYVLTAAFVIIACGIMALNRMDGDIAVLEDIARETRLRQLAVETEKSEMQKELAIKDTDSYIREKARSMYGYLMQGEILFVVENPEALYEDGEIPQVTVVEDTEG